MEYAYGIVRPDGHVQKTRVVFGTIFEIYATEKDATFVRDWAYKGMRVVRLALAEPQQEVQS